MESDECSKWEASIEVVLESEDEAGASEAERFLMDDELAHQDGLDPAEDDNYEQNEESSDSSSPSTTPASSPKKARYSTRRSRTRSLRAQPAASVTSWRTERDVDVCPVPKRFIPARPPGHQLNPGSTYTPLDLFKLYFSDDAVQSICTNTNKQAVKNIAKGKKYSWLDLNTREFFKYVGLNFFFSLVKLENIRDYWKKDTIFSVPFPANVMPRDRYRAISWNVHMSDPMKHAENDREKGTPDQDPLFAMKPLLDTIKQACRAFYHPRQNLRIVERTAATARTGTTRCVKAKPTSRGFELFVLSDSSSGYTVDFGVYTGKSRFASGPGLAYDSVMSLVKPSYLGSGYHLFVDHFYTSPKLFQDLFNMNIGACGTYRDDRRACPRTQANALKNTDPRGSVRWIRDGPLVFVKWRDTHEVSVCSTIHQAYSGSLVERRVKTQNGSWVTISVPCPTPVMEYRKNTGGVDLSDQLIQHYWVHHKSLRWYRTLFYYLLDIAATNSYLLHKELCREKQEEPVTHRTFLEELTAQLCGVTVAVPPAKAQSGHLPVSISNQTDTRKRATYGRKTCVHCRKSRHVSQSTPWKCKECDVALCLIADRNCFEAWHSVS